MIFGPESGTELPPAYPTAAPCTRFVRGGRFFEGSIRGCDRGWYSTHRRWVPPRSRLRDHPARRSTLCRRTALERAQDGRAALPSFRGWSARSCRRARSRGDALRDSAPPDGAQPAGVAELGAQVLEMGTNGADRHSTCVGKVLVAPSGTHMIEHLPLPRREVYWGRRWHDQVHHPPCEVRGTGTGRCGRPRRRTGSERHLPPGGGVRIVHPCENPNRARLTGHPLLSTPSEQGRLP